MNQRKKPQNRGNKPKPSLKQEKAAAAILKEMLKPTGRSLVEILEKEGDYSPESARQFSNVMAGIRPLLAPFEDRIAKHREKIMERMETKVESATYAELTRGLVATTQVHRLLTGKSTHNIGVVVQDRRKEIDRLIDEK